MTLQYTDLPEKCREQLSFEEQVLWCGKGRPTAWYDGAFLACVFGLVFGGFPLVMAYFALPDLFADPKVDGIVKVFVPAFLGLFVTIGFALFLSPLWHWLLTRRAVWVITNRRVVRFWGNRMKAWSGSQLVEEPEWRIADDGSRDFVFGRHWVSTKNGGHFQDDLIENVPMEDVALVESALLRLAESRRVEKDADLSARVSEVSRNCFQVTHDGVTGGVRIVYRNHRPVWGLSWLVFITVLFGVIQYAAYAAKDVPLAVRVGLTIPFVLGASPFVYALAGRREVFLQGGKGVYFNGVGAVGLRRHFTYDGQTLVHMGETFYQVNGRRLPEVQIRQAGEEKSKRLLAHSDEAVVAAFIQYIQENIRYYA